MSDEPDEEDFPATVKHSLVNNYRGAKGRRKGSPERSDQSLTERSQPGMMAARCMKCMKKTSFRDIIVPCI